MAVDAVSGRDVSSGRVDSARSATTVSDYCLYCRAKTPLVAKAIELISRTLRERSGLVVVEAPPEDAALVLDIQPGIGAEGYRIEDIADGQIVITGDSDLGLLYGVGKFLHGARYGEREVVPGAWRGVSVPQCSLRGMYLALHQNYYSFAPVEELTRYMEELALWGINTVAFHLPIPVDPTTAEARAAQARHRAILQGAKAAGMRIALLDSINCGDVDAPREAYAAEFPDTDPARRGFAGIRVCPSHPAGFAYLSRRMARYVGGFQDIGVDYVVAFPYDSGGCGCPDCWPWGARGFLKISQEFVRLARQQYPGIKFVLGTWCYDVCEKPDGEWDGLAKALAKDNTWVQYIMADSHFEFPRYPLEHGVPGGLPMINFAEISMWGRFPWGGFGANPLPERFQRIWDETERKLDGGLPYSEGIFEDINKIIFARFFWDKEVKAADAVRDYIAFEYAPEVVDRVAEAMALLERSYPFAEWRREDVERAYDLTMQADTLLPERARSSWRWRILYLRAVVDHELINNSNVPTDRCDAAYAELIRIFHLEDGWFCVTPRSRAYRAHHAAKQQRGELTAPPGHEQAGALPPGSDQGKMKDPARILSEAGRVAPKG